MSMFNYGIGGNEVKVDANESISDIPSNRTLLVQKLTNEPSVSPEAVYDLKTVDDVFEHFSPKVNLEFQDSEGNDIKESMDFKNLGEFGAMAIRERSNFLNKLDVEAQQFNKISRQLASNRALKKALEDPETRDAMISKLEQAVLEINKEQ